MQIAAAVFMARNLTTNAPRKQEGRRPQDERAGNGRRSGASVGRDRSGGTRRRRPPSGLEGRLHRPAVSPASAAARIAGSAVLPLSKMRGELVELRPDHRQRLGLVVGRAVGEQRREIGEVLQHGRRRSSTASAPRRLATRRAAACRPPSSPACARLDLLVGGHRGDRRIDRDGRRIVGEGGEGADGGDGGEATRRRVWTWASGTSGDVGAKRSQKANAWQGQLNPGTS